MTLVSLNTFLSLALFGKGYFPISERKVPVGSQQDGFRHHLQDYGPISTYEAHPNTGAALNPWTVNRVYSPSRHDTIAVEDIRGNKVP
jgi:hypothetical protein